ncbi:ERMES complex subunit [Allomyces javanicus]|nr:ERMES complex subunit [Allomyces javanicus]
MAFVFEWPRFSADFYKSAATELTAALNKGDKPPNIAGDIIVTELDLGTIAPDLEILELVELSSDKLRGIFRLSYAGDAYITLQTSVQANPIVDGHTLSIGGPQLGGLLGTSAAMIAANAPLIVPLQLKISQLRLYGIASLVVDQAKGITLAFKNDPLENVHVSSTFDHMATIRRFLQSEIEKLLKKLFKEDLPALVHSSSRRYVEARRIAARAGPDTLVAASAPVSPSRPTAARTTLPPAFHDRANTEPVTSTTITAGWVGNDGSAAIDEPVDLDRDDWVRVAKALHNPPDAPPPPDFFASLAQRLFRVPAAQPVSRMGLARAMDSDDDGAARGRDRARRAHGATASRSGSRSSSSSSMYSGSPPRVRRAGDGADSRAPSAGPASRRSSSATSRTSTMTTSTAVSGTAGLRVHRFNRQYVQQHLRAALAGLTPSPSSASLLSTSSSPAVLLSTSGAGGTAHARSATAPAGAPGAPTPTAGTVSAGQSRRGTPRMGVRTPSFMITSAPAPPTSSMRGATTLDPSANFMAAQLANLYNANQSISPFSREHVHSTFRTMRKAAPHVAHHMTPTAATAAAAADAEAAEHFVTDDGHHHVVHLHRPGRRGRRPVCRRVFTVDLRRREPEPAQEDDGLQESVPGSLELGPGEEEAWEADADGDGRDGLMAPRTRATFTIGESESEWEVAGGWR